MFVRFFLFSLIKLSHHKKRIMFVLAFYRPLYIQQIIHGLKNVVQMWINICFVFKSMYLKFKLLLVVPWQTWFFFFLDIFRLECELTSTYLYVITSHLKTYLKRGRRAGKLGNKVWEAVNFWDQFELWHSIDKKMIIIL